MVTTEHIVNIRRAARTMKQLREEGVLTPEWEAQEKILLSLEQMMHIVYAEHKKATGCGGCGQGTKNAS